MSTDRLTPTSYLVLGLLAQEFEPGRRYDEQDVNAVLERAHPDFAALRRYARVRLNDIISAVVATVGVLAFGPLYGLLLAVVAASPASFQPAVIVEDSEGRNNSGIKPARGSISHSAMSETTIRRRSVVADIECFMRIS